MRLADSLRLCGRGPVISAYDRARRFGSSSTGRAGVLCGNGSGTRGGHFVVPFVDCAACVGDFADPEFGLLGEGV